mmetsp:Transcript_91611/g.205121  ORF Transcript_91611/g.205121 Transcript_91611/m.205121 type:complete len:170 (-) Transcript_91611:150-659(-)
MVEACPWGSYDLEDESHSPLSCEEAVEVDLALRPLARGLCSDGVREAEGQKQERTEEEEGEGTGPAMDPFDFLYGDYNPWCNLEGYRYWHAHTEYSLLRGLQRFSSAAELLDGLASMLLGPEAPQRRSAVLEEMRSHQRGRVRETVQWWAHALLVTGQASRRAGRGHTT